MNTIHTKKITLPVTKADADWNFTVNTVMPITYFVRGEWDCQCGHHTTSIPGEILALRLGRCLKCGKKIEKVEEVNE